MNKHAKWISWYATKGEKIEEDGNSIYRKMMEAFIAGSDTAGITTGDKMAACPNCNTPLEEDLDIIGYSLWTCPNSECEKSFKYQTRRR